MRYRPPVVAPGRTGKGWVTATVAQEFWADHRQLVINSIIDYFWWAAFPMDYVIIGPVQLLVDELAILPGSHLVRVLAPMARKEDWKLSHGV